MTLRHCPECHGFREARWSRCAECGTDLRVGFRKRDAVLTGVLVAGLAVYAFGIQRDPLRQAYDLAMSCEGYSLTDVAWIEWFERKGTTVVSGWVFYTPISQGNDPEICTKIETALHNGSKVGTLLRRLNY